MALKIVNLIENTEGAAGCAFAHGLSFYIETKKHKLLVDLGPSGQTLDNASRLGIDVSQVDTMILSHGHYDHSGGILPFTTLNAKAQILMQRTATLDYYADDGENAVGERFRYIGIDKKIPDLPQVRFVDGDVQIDEELELFTVKQKKTAIPFTNQRLLIRTADGFARDGFDHEQYLVIHCDGRRILISGCAHNGILNILDAFSERYGGAPDMVISGFHLMKKTPYSEAQREEIEETARKLLAYPTQFVTCHCTGEEAFAIMKEILGEQLWYVHSGEEIPCVFLGEKSGV